MPKIFISNGKKLFTISGIADSIGRDKQTLKKWIQQGTIPMAPFMKMQGKYEVRLYPEYFIKAIKDVMWELKIRRGFRIDHILFRAKLKLAIKELENDYD